MKRTTSLLMAICMVFALMVNASAFELSAEDTVKPADPIQQMVDEKMAVILPQLAAQDALYLAIMKRFFTPCSQLNTTKTQFLL